MFLEELWTEDDKSVLRLRKSFVNASPQTVADPEGELVVLDFKPFLFERDCQRFGDFLLATAGQRQREERERPHRRGASKASRLDGPRPTFSSTG